MSPNDDDLLVEKGDFDDWFVGRIRGTRRRRRFQSRYQAIKWGRAIASRRGVRLFSTGKVFGGWVLEYPYPWDREALRD